MGPPATVAAEVDPAAVPFGVVAADADEVPEVALVLPDAGEPDRPAPADDVVPVAPPVVPDPAALGGVEPPDEPGWPDGFAPPGVVCALPADEAGLVLGAEPVFGRVVVAGAGLLGLGLLVGLGLVDGLGLLGGFGALIEGGRIAGCAPAPKLKPTAVPGCGR